MSIESSDEFNKIENLYEQLRVSLVYGNNIKG